MEFRFLVIFVMTLVLAVAARHAPLSAENYWNSVFPNTPMPKAMQNLLLPSAAETTLIRGNHMKAALADMVNTHNKDGISDARQKYSRQVARWNESAELTYVPTDEDVFFFETKLRPGTKLNFKDLTAKSSKTTFLPRSVADSIPFSTQNFAQVLTYFSTRPRSAESKILKEAIEDCERPAIGGENVYCATSMESFVDLGVAMLGKKNIQLLSTELDQIKEGGSDEFSVGEGVKKMGESEIVCHKLDYPYAVFFCHSIDKTDVYKVPLIWGDGTRAIALAVCHKDTSSWNPKHWALMELRVEPGTVPVCHFLLRDTLVWIPN